MSSGIGESVTRLSNEINAQKAINRVGRASSTTMISYVTNKQWDIEGTMKIAQVMGSAYVDVRIPIDGQGIIPVCQIEYDMEINGTRLNSSMLSSGQADGMWNVGYKLANNIWLDRVDVGVARSTGAVSIDFGGIEGFQGVGNRDGAREYQFWASYSDLSIMNSTATSWNPPNYKLKFRILSTRKVSAKCYQN